MDVVEGIESGVITGLLVVESDPFHHFPDEERLEKAFNKLGLLIVLDCLPSSMACRASIFLPTLNPFETGSTFINQEGRIQFAAPVHAGGTPICQETGGNHPHREYGREIPGRDQKPAWQGLMRLAQAMSLPMETVSIDDGGGPLKWIAGEVPALRELGEKTYPVDGIRTIDNAGPSVVGSSGGPDGQGRERTHMAVGMTPEPIPPEGHLRLLLVEWTFGTEELSSYSCVIQEVEKEPFACMHPDDAAAMGLSDGDRICIPIERGTVQFLLELTSHMARGILVVPRHRQIPWQRFGSFTPTVDPACIKKL
jgi:NADH-quinone oxidoreductase subunit G